MTNAFFITQSYISHDQFPKNKIIEKVETTFSPQNEFFGRTQGFENIYQELDNETRSYFIEQGVTHVPITVYNGSVYQGIKTTEFFEKEINCSWER